MVVAGPHIHATNYDKQQQQEETTRLTKNKNKTNRNNSCSVIHAQLSFVRIHINLLKAQQQTT